MAEAGGRQAVKRALRRTLPLAVRRPLARLLDRRGGARGRWWASELLRDWAERDPGAYHRYLWTHHMNYAETYEVEQRFGEGRLHPTRRLLFDELERWLDGRTIASVFEVGCSLGYLLHHAEMRFPAAATIEGLDVDRAAVAAGRRFLDEAGSKVRLYAEDMAGLAGRLGGRRFDLFLCCGVLMYVSEEEAARLVATMLKHTRTVVAMAGLAHPERDNAELERSEVRRRDGALIHNLDRMVERAGGEVAWRRWDGARSIDGNSVYFVFARARGATA